MGKGGIRHTRDIPRVPLLIMSAIVENENGSDSEVKYLIGVVLNVSPHFTTVNEAC